MRTIGKWEEFFVCSSTYNYYCTSLNLRAFRSDASLLLLRINFKQEECYRASELAALRSQYTGKDHHENVDILLLQTRHGEVQNGNLINWP